MTYNPPENNEATAAEQAASEFEQFVRAEAEKKMMETQKRYELAWQRVAASIQETGQAKANLDMAKKEGTSIMQAAMAFRNIEKEMLDAVNSMIDLIAREHSL